MAEAYIYDAIRSPRGKGRADGALHEVTAVRLSADMLNALKARNDLATDVVDDVIWGNVTQIGEQGGCLARSAALLSDLGEAVPGLRFERMFLHARRLAFDHPDSGERIELAAPLPPDCVTLLNRLPPLPAAAPSTDTPATP